MSKAKSSGQRKTNLGEMLRVYRLLRGISIRELAKDIGISAATLFRIEEGREMELDTFQTLLTWFRRPAPEKAQP